MKNLIKEKCPFEKREIPPCEVCSNQDLIKGETIEQTRVRHLLNSIIEEGLALQDGFPVLTWQSFEKILNLISQTEKETRERVIGKVERILERNLLGGYKVDEIKDGEIKLTFGAYKEILNQLKS